MKNILFETTDPRVFRVLLHRSRFIKHIWPNHPLVQVEHICSVIEDPEFITQDVHQRKIENYYRQETIAEYPDLYVKVCVLFRESDQGRIITSFVVDWPKPEEEVIWLQ